MPDIDELDRMWRAGLTSAFGAGTPVTDPTARVASRVRRRQRRRVATTSTGVALVAVLIVTVLAFTPGARHARPATPPTLARGPVQCSPITSRVRIQAGVGGQLRFGPTNPTVEAGCIQILFQVVSASHTLRFEDPTAARAFPLLDAKTSVWAGRLAPGRYVFSCTIPGHRTAGMIGTLTVS